MFQTVEDSPPPVHNFLKAFNLRDIYSKNFFHTLCNEGELYVDQIYVVTFSAQEAILDQKLCAILTLDPL